MNDSELIPQSNNVPVEYGVSDVDKMPVFSFALDDKDREKEELIAKHKAWLKSIRHECPNPAHPYRIGVYIRYFNQTKYENYLDFHKKQFLETLESCPLWTFVDFYIDEGSTAPLMESAPEWTRLLDDCFEGKVDLIITQKVSNVSRRPDELTLISRALATQEHPIGIYFISEDIFTLATYYLDDMRDTQFQPDEPADEISGNRVGGALGD